MYRVELKALEGINIELGGGWVPNVPCGVESRIEKYIRSVVLLVPNVPCGVERMRRLTFLIISPVFLMYRVELKAVSAELSKTPPVSS